MKRKQKPNGKRRLEKMTKYNKWNKVKIYNQQNFFKHKFLMTVLIQSNSGYLQDLREVYSKSINVIFIFPRKER